MQRLQLRKHLPQQSLASEVALLAQVAPNLSQLQQPARHGNRTAAPFFDEASAAGMASADAAGHDVNPAAATGTSSLAASVTPLALQQCGISTTW